jgi:preprotein translocase subunit YajC
MDPLFLPLLIIAALALPLIMNVRRQKRSMAEAQALQSSLADGDRVVTTSGLYGTVVGTADDTAIDLEIAPGVRTRWLRAAIRERATESGGIPARPSAPLAEDGAKADNS